MSNGRKTVMALKLVGKGPVCRVGEVKQIELEGEGPVVIRNENGERVYELEGTGVHEVTLKPGRYQVESKQEAPFTVYAVE